MAIAATTQLLSKTQLEFLQEVVPPALASDRDYGIPASVTLAQAILESGWGKSSLYREANNPFGIKHVHHSGEEPYTEFDADTWECRGGSRTAPTAEHAVFQRFHDLESAFRAHAMLFRRLPRYRPALEALSDWRRFAVAIQKCGYSTDPEYAEKLIKLVERYRLDDPRALAWYAAGSDPGSAAIPAANTGRQDAGATAGETEAHGQSKIA